MFIFSTSPGGRNLNGASGTSTSRHRQTQNVGAIDVDLAKPVERQVEARSKEDVSGSIVRTLYFVETYLTSGKIVLHAMIAVTNDYYRWVSVYHRQIKGPTWLTSIFVQLGQKSMHTITDECTLWANKGHQIIIGESSLWKNLGNHAIYFSVWRIWTNKSMHVYVIDDIPHGQNIWICVYIIHSN